MFKRIPFQVTAHVVRCITMMKYCWMNVLQTFLVCETIVQATNFLGRMGDCKLDKGVYETTVNGYYAEHKRCIQSSALDEC